MSDEQMNLEVNFGFLPLLHFLVGGLQNSRRSSSATHAQIVLPFWARGSPGASAPGSACVSLSEEGPQDAAAALAARPVCPALQPLTND